jgi:DNA-binding beta-propeller fold protein YncE
MRELPVLVMIMAVFSSAVCLAGTCSLSSIPRAEVPAPVLDRAVLNSFPSPDTAPMGVDWDEAGQILYHVDEDSGKVYSFQPPSWMPALLFDVPTQIGIGATDHVGNGICYIPDGRDGSLYITDYGGYDADPINRVYQFSPDGTLLGSWDVDAICTNGVLGICFDGVSFWLSDFRGDLLECDESFNVIAAYGDPSGSGAGGALDFDPDSGLFYMTHYLLGTIYVLDGSLNLLDSFAGPAVASIGVAVGRQVTRDAGSLWFASYDTDIIYEIDDEYESPVERSSWGRIKAVYR